MQKGEEHVAMRKREEHVAMQKWEEHVAIQEHQSWSHQEEQAKHSKDMGASKAGMASQEGGSSQEVGGMELQEVASQEVGVASQREEGEGRRHQVQEEVWHTSKLLSFQEHQNPSCLQQCYHLLHWLHQADPALCQHYQVHHRPL